MAACPLPPKISDPQSQTRKTRAGHIISMQACKTNRRQMQSPCSAVCSALLLAQLEVKLRRHGRVPAGKRSTSTSTSTSTNTSTSTSTRTFESTSACTMARHVVFSAYACPAPRQVEASTTPETETGTRIWSCASYRTGGWRGYFGTKTGYPEKTRVFRRTRVFR